jgi:cation diffusion facilitator CzcD-associated flavoprotein CzcO
MTTVAVVGAGPAGLAAGACLRSAGIDFVLLEKQEQIASSWRRHYARLRLHTLKKYSALPFLPFPDNYPRYVPRALVLEYFESYAARFDLRPVFGQCVTAIDRAADGWVVTTPDTVIAARFVVIASGYNATPVVPQLPGMETFRGRCLHSIDYVDAKPFAGQSVLVIGMGNTGAEVALDLAEGGALPTIAVRDGVHIVPRELFGIPIQIVGMLATRLLPDRLSDLIFRPILDLALGNPARHGIRRPPQGMLQQIAQSGRIPVIDVGTLRSIAAGSVKLAPGIAAINEDGAVFCDGSCARYDAIICATGYRPNYQEFLHGRGGVDRARASSGDGIYFIGFRNVVSGLLREIGREAHAVTADIVRRIDAARDRREP